MAASIIPATEAAFTVQVVSDTEYVDAAVAVLSTTKELYYTQTIAGCFFSDGRVVFQGSRTASSELITQIVLSGCSFRDVRLEGDNYCFSIS